MSAEMRNLGRPLAYRRSDGGRFADEISAIGIGLKNGVRDDTVLVEIGTGTRTKMFDACFLLIITLAVAVAAADKQERDNPQGAQDSAASDNASYD